MGTIGLKETECLFVLSCSVPNHGVRISDTVLNTADMFCVSMELAIYLWSKH